MENILLPFLKYTSHQPIIIKVVHCMRIHMHSHVCPRSYMLNPSALPEWTPMALFHCHRTKATLTIHLEHYLFKIASGCSYILIISCPPLHNEGGYNNNNKQAMSIVTVVIVMYSSIVFMC
uniref:Uncharacterized protein n=1 Tax=Octopus bimaculoides TaxID=37653 RepID=A0A0L8GW88_OCTBM